MLRCLTTHCSLTIPGASGEMGLKTPLPLAMCKLLAGKD